MEFNCKIKEQIKMLWKALPALSLCDESSGPISSFTEWGAVGTGTCPVLDIKLVTIWTAGFSKYMLLLRLGLLWVVSCHNMITKPVVN